MRQESVDFHITVGAIFWPSTLPAVAVVRLLAAEPAAAAASLARSTAYRSTSQAVRESERPCPNHVRRWNQFVADFAVMPAQAGAVVLSRPAVPSSSVLPRFDSRIGSIDSAATRK